MENLLTLEEKVKIAKKTLETELNNIKRNLPHQMTYEELGNHMDAIHELEKKGFRNLTELETIKIHRILNAINTKLKLNLN